MADDVEAPEPDALEELDAPEEDVELEADVLEDDVAEVPLDVFPNLLVAALNADDAFGAEVLERAAEFDVDELDAPDEAVLLPAVELEVESRPYPLRLPLKLGVMRDT